MITNQSLYAKKKAEKSFLLFLLSVTVRPPVTHARQNRWKSFARSKTVTHLNGLKKLWNPLCLHRQPSINRNLFSISTETRLRQKHSSDFMQKSTLALPNYILKSVQEMPFSYGNKRLTKNKQFNIDLTEFI